MIRLYHNHRCSKSRDALALLEQHGEPFEVINYLDSPPTVAELKCLLAMLGISARQLLRSTEEAYKQLALDDLSLDEDTLMLDGGHDGEPQAHRKTDHCRQRQGGYRPASGSGVFDSAVALKANLSKKAAQGRPFLFATSSLF